MRKSLVLLLVVLTAAAIARAADVPLLLQSPTINRTQIVFAYGGYLWGASRDGGEAHQLTSGGHESRPIFSPDGKWIAFTGEYDGNVDVYVIPASGGMPKRLTWHPDADVAVGWTPDGSKVLFNSAREAYSTFNRLYEVPLEGGWPTALPMWRAEGGSLSRFGA